jgi:shikimate kinase
VIPSNNIFLVGPMGAGKTTIGRLLAKELGLEFLDSDREITERTGVDIPTIFEFEGEAGFREREAVAIDELSRREGIVLATGGGAVLREQNRHWLAERGFVVFLWASVDQQVERTRRDKNRPLLQTGDPRGKLEALMREREPLYREVADLVIETGRASPRSVARRILKQLRQLETNTDHPD